MPELQGPKSPPTADKARVQKIIERLENAHSDAKLDLDFTTPLELLVALILAAQARDDLVNKITPELFKKYRTAEAYARAPLSKLQAQIGKIKFGLITHAQTITDVFSRIGLTVVIEIVGKNFRQVQIHRTCRGQIVEDAVVGSCHLQVVGDAHIDIEPNRFSADRGGVGEDTVLGGAVIVETMFSLPGIGRMTLNAVNTRSYPIVQGGVLTIGLMFMLVNLVTDLLYAVLNPRIKYE